MYKFKLKLEYELKANDEEGAIEELVNLIKRDWPYYADEGELTSLPTKLDS